MHTIRLIVLFLFLHSTAGSVDSSGQGNKYAFNVRGEAYGGYYISFEIGTPSQYVDVLIDSGSSNFAIAVNQDQANHSFDFAKSETFEKLDDPVSIHYTEGSWSGYLARDVVNLCSGVPCAISMQFACISSSENVFENSSAWSGILGLAYPLLAKPDKLVLPFLDTLVANGTGDIFSISLCGPLLNGFNYVSTKGKILIGYTSTYFYDGDMIFTPIIKEWYYEVIITGLKVGDLDLDVPCSKFNDDKSIVDTGSTFLSFPQEIYDVVIGQIRLKVKSLSENFWTQQQVECLVDADIYESFPSLTISLYHTDNSSFSLVVSPELYILKFPKLSGKNGSCFKLAVSATKKGTVIGATVLKGFYVVFDRENKRIGFANSTCKDILLVSSDSKPSVYKPFNADNKIANCRLLSISDKGNIIWVVVYLFVAILLGFAVAIFVKKRKS